VQAGVRNESAAGAYVMKVFDRLGIGEAMKAGRPSSVLPVGPAAASAVPQNAALPGRAGMGPSGK
jgi:hypothetical protein